MLRRSFRSVLNTQTPFAAASLVALPASSQLVGSLHFASQQQQNKRRKSPTKAAAATSSAAAATKRRASPKRSPSSPPMPRAAAGSKTTLGSAKNQLRDFAAALVPVPSSSSSSRGGGKALLQDKKTSKEKATKKSSSNNPNATSLVPAQKKHVLAAAMSVVDLSTRPPPDEEEANVPLCRLPDTLLVQLYDYKGPRRRYVTLTFGSEGFHLERMCRDLKNDLESSGGAQLFSSSSSSSSSALPPRWTLKQNNPRGLVLDVAAPQPNAGANNDAADLLTTSLIQGVITHVEGFGYGVSRAYVTLTPGDDAESSSSTDDWLMMKERLVYHYFLFRKMSLQQLDDLDQQQQQLAAPSSKKEKNKTKQLTAHEDEDAEAIADVIRSAVDAHVLEGQLQYHHQQPLQQQIQQQQQELLLYDEDDAAFEVARTLEREMLGDSVVEMEQQAAAEGKAMELMLKREQLREVAVAQKKQQQKQQVAVSSDVSVAAPPTDPATAPPVELADGFDFFEIPQVRPTPPALPAPDAAATAHAAAPSADTIAAELPEPKAETLSAPSDIPEVDVAELEAAQGEEERVFAAARQEEHGNSMNSISNMGQSSAPQQQEQEDQLSAAVVDTQVEDEEAQQQKDQLEAQTQEHQQQEEEEPAAAGVASEVKKAQKEEEQDDGFDPDDLQDDHFRVSEIEMPAVDDVLGAVQSEPHQLVLAREELELLASSVDVDINNEEDENDEIVSAAKERQEFEDPDVWAHIVAQTAMQFTAPRPYHLASRPSRMEPVGDGVKCPSDAAAKSAVPQQSSFVLTSTTLGGQKQEEHVHSA